MKIEFTDFTLESFKRMWNSSYEIGDVEAPKATFENSSKEEWEPLYNRTKDIVKEIIIDGIPAGWIFLSAKEDGGADLGYGLHAGFRGKGLFNQVLTTFLKVEVPLLDQSIDHVRGTTEASNIPSQKVLLRLGFKKYQEVDDELNGIKVKWFKYKITTKELMSDLV